MERGHDPPAGDAVQLALVNSPALQAILAENWAGAAAAAQSGRIANPIFALTRMRIGDELEIERALTFGLLDLLLLPQRQAIATQRIGQAQLQLTAEVIEQVTLVRQAWVNAVAAQQSLHYAEQVFASAEASAELARRMQAAGNFSKLARARQQAFYADAATQLAAAQHLAAATREQLVRQTGLTDRQAETMKLPDRLPDLPVAPRDPAAVGHAATAGRLDIRLARAALEANAATRSTSRVQSFTDIELGVLGSTHFDDAAGTRATGRGYEISVRLPVFDWGDAQRDALDAQTLALANRLEATVRAAGSNLRVAYSAYRTAYDIARHYRDEILPLRKTIAEENVLRYNGMLIGVFELLADSRDQIGSVIAAIGAQHQFWLADAALQATIMGRPAPSTVTATGTANKGGGDGAH
ncbi:MAG: TolC family protein [Betaproteobacteria bacterium]|nr:TolC family protein [Betaproteobacteria bacterium]